MQSKIIVFLVAPLLLFACGNNNTKENEQLQDTLVTDTAQKGIENAQKEISDTNALPEVKFDTAFNFAAKPPIDSVVLKSGVKLIHLQHGKGSKVKKYDVAAINYRGMLTNGKLIESNEMLKRTVPFVMGLEMTFAAFDEALLQCDYGDKIRFVIPAARAYGKKGRGLIPPNSDLVYEVDIVQKVTGKKTTSGVEYFPLVENTLGKKPLYGKTVAVGYVGWVQKTGKLFDASAASGNLYSFELGTGKAIKAWHEVVAEMRQGEKYLMLAPAQTCYGEKGVPELVPANSDLVYIIELKGVE